MITTEQKQVVAVLTIILRHTSATPIKGKDLETLTGVDARIVADMCSYFYRIGLPVGSGSNGYFQTVGEAERKAQYLREIGRGVSTIRKAVAGRKAQADIGTLSLFEQQEAA